MRLEALIVVLVLFVIQNEFDVDVKNTKYDLPAKTTAVAGAVVVMDATPNRFLQIFLLFDRHQYR